MNINGMRFGRQTRWAELPQSIRRGIGIAASVQIVLLISAIVDLVRRPSSQVRGGPKWAWLPVLFVNFVGPLAYFAFGRVHGDASDNPGLRL